MTIATAVLALLLGFPGVGHGDAEGTVRALRLPIPDGPGPPARVTPLLHSVFHDAVIHFTPVDPELHDTAEVTHEDNGRVAVRTVTLPEWSGFMRATATVTISPIPEDELTMYDRWDRAGNVRLCPVGAPEVELVKFVTAYGGETVHEVDVSHLVPLMAGECTFRAFVDTWSSPGWLVDLEIRFWLEEAGRPPGHRATGAQTGEAGPSQGEPAWCRGAFYHESVAEEDLRDGPIETRVDVPPGADRVLMYYLTSGHCTDGRGADEFAPKDNVITIDGRVVHRFRPWRDDCRRFREVNPYTRRWTDGSWSSDYSRSGWCPGDVVRPLVLDLTDSLEPGSHTIGFAVEDVRPKDEDGHFGYWRVSAYLVGWKE
jgi:hypothetical protein